ncbi:type III-B CRISPR-associated protein Cas10/Cmr2 [uncultured Desulfobacter sp.]|uniref:type III-B CRISPR-associated protein Cas10/Cmr2 n=1 Tax=uncultured Desulfobacter sp. TaxID=240139 RepID=UPI002AAB283E|nr:type III-B CRISPR-associated protein Cas10/Cmr2 [uncultured Desulfobacter sp.]
MTFQLHLTFGPVQGFVAQARRTRDLYSGSFLLSWLAYKAMDAVESAGGTILLPDFQTVKRLIETDKVRHGVAPNRFAASFSDKQQAAETARQAQNALLKEWRKIVGRVWARFVSPAAPRGNGTEIIWERQIENFWEIAWTVGSEKETSLLDHRKNWRTPPISVEGGDHCTLMGQYQELSGFFRSKESGSQDAFWKNFRKNLDSRLNLREDERLCAIALVKRFFPEVAVDIIGYDLAAQTWPSTVSIAALPFQKTILKNRQKDNTLYGKAKAYADLVKTERGALVSGNTVIQMIQSYPLAAGDFKKLSGNFLNRTALQNKQGTPLNNPDTAEERRRVFVNELLELEKASGDRAGNFYALLLMDGDRMGELIRDNDAATITKALTDFSAKAPDIIKKHDGITVYAGGDDLFALLPIDTALDCAWEVSEAYKQVFKTCEIKNKEKATISAAVIFAHYSIPLRQVIARAHSLLDDTAKEQTGRDAIALALFKPGGEICSWAGKFKQFKSGTQQENCFQPLTSKFKEADSVDSLSYSYLYNLKQRFSALEEDVGSFTKRDLIDLFTAELIHGSLDKDPEKAKMQREKAMDLISQLVAVCYDEKTKRLNFDGARLVRFLAVKGKEGNDR